MRIKTGQYPFHHPAPAKMPPASFPFVSIAAAIATALLLFATQADAHGYVQEVTLGSTKYAGYNPYADPYVFVFPSL
ncbi:hypothetical protein NMY22_g19469 [Coprinellus aureogranulatus]|nr:hypothetical protein NMY22_g19469 [Coprinellus aureogranulatus]